MKLRFKVGQACEIKLDMNERATYRPNVLHNNGKLVRIINTDGERDAPYFVERIDGQDVFKGGHHGGYVPEGNLILHKAKVKSVVL